MYIILDNTMSTQANHFPDSVLAWANVHRMADLIGFKGYENASAPFTPTEYQVEWKGDRHYLDFSFGNTYNATCQYPRFWDESGFPVTESSDIQFGQLEGCYDSEFDQVSKC
jgi:alpha-1,3-glucan synthase